MSALTAKKQRYQNLSFVRDNTDNKNNNKSKSEVNWYRSGYCESDKIQHGSLLFLLIVFNMYSSAKTILWPQGFLLPNYFLDTTVDPTFLSH